MLKSKKFNIVLALIIAIALWAYVLGEVNPESSVTIKNVPINFTNQDSLEDTGLTLLKSSDTTININISGKRTVITKADADDFSVTADIEGLKKGENTVRLNISGPDDVKIEHVNIEKVKVEIDELATSEKDVKVVINGQPGDDKEADIIEQSLDTVKVTGAKTLVDKVDKVNAVVELKNIGSEMSSFDTELTPVDKGGLQVLNVRLGNSKVKITAVMLNKKTVNLNVPVTGENSGDVERIVSVPKTVMIKGTEDALKDITEITCKTLDVSGVYSNTSIELIPQLPDGVKLSDDSDGISAKVTVKDLSKKTFEFGQNDINLLNKSEGLTYTVNTAKLSVEAIGRENVINELSAADFTVSADVSGLGKGTHTVTVVVTCGKDILSAELSVERVEITIE
ncbi:MAG: hypothetical protein DBY08_04405 [Clostridiales bacterium]|mgnify:CR=1 FL=1|nr:hypothetical protein [Bacillota bacterium]MEE0516438.1 CdaR family protein [Anaerovoracaceae bacterium]PWL93855.1 MAG: hypothetical protein DBY08_04405 [Clostridiales bacterium]